MKKFNVTSGVMVCSDPCYEIPTWCQGIIKNVKNGEWEAEVETSNEGSWGERIAVLKVNHVNAKLSGGFKLLNFDAGVDSGQFGFFDRDFYRNDEIAKDLPKHDFGDDYDVNEGDSWYRAVCDLTLAEESWGVLSGGVVSTSGFGDGSYNVYGCKDESGEYVAFYVEFIGSHDEHEDDWGDDEDDDWG